MKVLLRAGVLLLVITSAFGCAVGNVYDYRSAPVILPVQGDFSVSLKVDDLRPYVTNGDKQANFIGLRRGGYGNPFNVTTASGEPLANDIVVALGQGLENAGYKLNAAEGTDRQLTLTIREWKSDVFSNLKIIYDVDLVVHDASGHQLGKSTITGEEAAGGGAMMDQHNEAVRRAFEAKMSQLFADPEIVAALSG
jgi:hypothetical protein